LIELILRRLGKSESIDQIILAIPNSAENDLLEQEAKKLDITIFRGSENNLIERYYQAAKMHNAEIICRLPADNVFPDYEEIDRAIEFHLTNNQTGFTTNLAQIKKSLYPDGIGIEIFSFKALEKIFKSETTSDQKEHIHLNFLDYSNPNPQIVNSSFKVASPKCPKEKQCPDLVLDINTYNDYKKILSAVGSIAKDPLDITTIDLIKWHKSLMQE
jgi:spore coat polysaccharide biosynthesis protein SpsF